MLSSMGRETASFSVDLDRFYQALGKLATQLGGVRHLADCDRRTGWPDRGVYFFFEPGEFRAPPSQQQLRVVRVGTHAVSAGSKATLWSRLKQHRGNGKPGEAPGGGNHRGSIFRRHLGVALLRAGRFDGEAPATWGVGSSATNDVVLREEPVERLVSEYMGRLPCLWLEADDEPSTSSVRSYIEKNSIALLSRGTAIDPSSPGWLGRHAADDRIRSSGLWNVNYVGDSYDPVFLDVFAQLAAGRWRAQTPSPAISPHAPEPPSAETAALDSLAKPVLALISCTKKKADHPCPAAELYRPSTFFGMAYEVARHHAGTTMILSAKYGLVRPEQILAPYEQTLADASRVERQRWAQSVHAQLRAVPEYQAATTVVWFAGESYRGELLPRVQHDGKECIVPMEGLAQGEQLA